MQRSLQPGRSRCHQPRAQARAALLATALSVTAAARCSRGTISHACLPSGASERRSDADQEGEQQEDRRRDQAQAAQEGEPRRHQDGPELRQEQHPAPIPEIRHGAGQREEQDRRLGRGCTSATMSGVPASVVISQAAPTPEPWCRWR